VRIPFKTRNPDGIGGDTTRAQVESLIATAISNPRPPAKPRYSAGTYARASRHDGPDAPNRKTGRSSTRWRWSGITPRRRSACRRRRTSTRSDKLLLQREITDFAASRRCADYIQPGHLAAPGELRGTLRALRLINHPRLPITTAPRFKSHDGGLRPQTRLARPRPARCT